MKNTEYVSDVTKFINNYRDANPEIKVKQIDLRKTWWDSDKVDIEDANSLSQDRVKLDGYAYFTYHNIK